MQLLQNAFYQGVDFDIGKSARKILQGQAQCYTFLPGINAFAAIYIKQV
jgi:hypothetical protein